MAHHAPLITTLVAGIVLAFLLGALANRLRLSPLVGYLLAGVAIGPATPGYVADLELAPELAEIGIILLMFGVGLHFSLRDMLSVRVVAVPGALVQIAVSTLLGLALGWLLGWSVVPGLVFGLALSVASTVVLLRALQERHLLDTDRGRIAVGWLIVEDLAMVLVLVLLPVLAELMESDTARLVDVAVPLGITLAKVAAFVALMLVVGSRVIPWALHRIAGTGSRELFTLAVLATAIGIAFGSAALFGVSFALGAFFAGMVLAGSELSHRAAEDSLPLRDAFQVLFFVSVGMLFDPRIVLTMPMAVAGTVLVIVVGKSVAAYLIVRAFGRSRTTALTIAASLAQIGEFSFILATLAVALGLLPVEGQDLILAGAILSILVNPLFFAAIDRLPVPATLAPTSAAPGDEERHVSRLEGHAVVVGYGTVGRHLAEALGAAGRPFLVIDDGESGTEPLRAAGVEVITGNAAEDSVLTDANLAAAEWLFVAIPNVFEAGQVIEKARRISPGLRIVARADSTAESGHLSALGAEAVVIARGELARAMIGHALGDGSAAAQRATS